MVGLYGLNMHTQLPSRARGINFSLDLGVWSYFICANSEAFGKTGRMGLVAPPEISIKISCIGSIMSYPIY